MYSRAKRAASHDQPPQGADGHPKPSIQPVACLGDGVFLSLPGEGAYHPDDLFIGDPLFQRRLVVAAEEVSLLVFPHHPVEHIAPLRALIERDVVFFQLPLGFGEGDGVLSVPEHGKHTAAVGGELHLLPRFQQLTDQRVQLSQPDIFLTQSAHASKSAWRSFSKKLSTACPAVASSTSYSSSNA